jgi:hypothetical protein
MSGKARWSASASIATVVMRNGFDIALTWRQVADRSRNDCQVGIRSRRLRQYRTLSRNLSLDYMDPDPL